MCFFFLSAWVGVPLNFVFFLFISFRVGWRPVVYFSREGSLAYSVLCRVVPFHVGWRPVVFVSFCSFHVDHVSDLPAEV